MRGLLLCCALMICPVLLRVDRACASTSDLSCLPQGRPAATLLVPYFEIDLENADGRSTLFSISNAGPSLVTIRVVLWTECGIPVLSFDRWLDAQDVLPINLRDVIAGGTLPDPGFACQSGAPTREHTGTRELDNASRAALEARLSGQPDPDDGLCYGLDRRGEPRVARGYATIDVVDRPCDLGARYSTDEGYFASDGSGIAGDSNALWGDVFQIDPSENFSQGHAAVDIRADRRRAAQLSPFRPPFYDRLASDRLPLGAEFRSRYFVGGAFDGGTELILWRGETQREGMTCGQTCGAYSLTTAFVFDEAGQAMAPQLLPTRAKVEKLRVGTDLLAGRAGSITLVVQPQPDASPPLPTTSAWLQSTFSARGRFSVGLETTVTESVCNLLRFGQQEVR